MDRLALPLLLVIACSSPTPAPASRGSATADAAEPVVKVVKELPAAAAVACASAFEAIQSGSTFGVLSQCAELFPSCAATWRTVSPRPAEGEPFRGCRDAYCPSLAEPRPALCDGRTIDRATTSAAGAQLLAAILIHDHQIDPTVATQLGGVLASFLGPQPKVMAPP